VEKQDANIFNRCNLVDNQLMGIHHNARTGRIDKVKEGEEMNGMDIVWLIVVVIVIIVLLRVLLGVA
jgi:hypothetical protein